MAEVHHTKDCGQTRDYHFRHIHSAKIRFGVKAEKDAAICLSPKGHMDSDMYQVFIGCWGGGESGIRRGKQEDVVKVDTPHILSADEFREFWITVKRGVVKVGKKGKRKPFMAFEDPERLEDIRFYGYSTGWGQEGDWIFNDVHHTEDCGHIRDYHFRYIRSPKIKFGVKAERDAAICLSPKKHMDSDMYQVFIGCWGGGKSGIRRGKQENVVKVDTPHILSADEFREFWITVKRGVVKVGKKGERKPFMTFEDPERLEDIKFYGYSTGYGAEGDWIFNDENDESSSSSTSGDSSSDSDAKEINSLKQRPIAYKRPARWVPGYGGHLPRHPVCGGEGNDRLVYVGMAKHEGGHILGMVVPSENICYIPFGGKSVSKKEYYVLSNPSTVKLVWKDSSGGAVPTGALEGGYTEDGEKLYVGRVKVDGVVSCGKVHPSHGVCYVPYGGAEHGHRNYEVLCGSALPCRIRVKRNWTINRL